MERNSRFRTFGLSALLIAVTWFVAMLAGYQRGYGTGRADGVEDKRLTEISTRSYYVGKLVAPRDSKNETDKLNYSSFVELLKQTVAPDSWGNGQYSVQEFPDMESLIVTQDGRNHDEIKLFIDRLNKLVERRPAIIPNTADQNAEKQTLTSRLGNRVVEVTIEPSKDLPIWAEDAMFLPVNAGAAIAIASRKLDELSQNVPLAKAELEACSLKPWGPGVGYWFWLVEFNTWSDEKSSPKLLQLAVLLDGTCGSISLKTEPENAK